MSTPLIRQPVHVGQQLIENQDYLTKQLITYLGNKRRLLGFIGRGLELVKNRLGKAKLTTFDVFSGSGVVARFFKQHAEAIFVNDLEPYSTLINECYLTNSQEFNHLEFKEIFRDIRHSIKTNQIGHGFIAELYTPQNDEAVKPGERVFFTRRNGQFLDSARQAINNVPGAYQKYLLAPLLSEASIHANTAGIFKGFYKDPTTGIGRFGGKKNDALLRIRSDIDLPYPVFSNFNCYYKTFNGDSNVVCQDVPEVDLAYLDPPYNQHPYGSNYFMLNTILDYRRPTSYSAVSGIPTDWQRSNYNKKQLALKTLAELVFKIKAKFLIISFNSEGFISLPAMKQLLNSAGKLTVLQTRYNTFRGSRNLFNRQAHVTEYLYLLEKD